MSKSFHSFVPFLISTSFFLLINSCQSSYRIANSSKYLTSKKEMIQLEDVWLDIWVYDISAQEYYVTCTFDDVTKDKTLTLSGLIVKFVNEKNHDTLRSSNPVKYDKILHTMTKGDTEYIKDEDVKFKNFALNPNINYRFSYSFMGTYLKKPLKRIRIYVEATLSNNGKIMVINKCYPFKRIHYLNISGS